MKPIRQGDVRIESIGEIPKGARKKRATKRGHVLMEGEATGHAHTVTPADADLLIKEAETFLRVHYETQVKHDTHDPVVLAPGTYRVLTKREFQRGEIKRLAD